MDITWYGHNCFRITERGKLTVVTDPFGDDIGIPAPKLKGDIVTVSRDAPGYNHIDAVKGQPRLLYLPGEYEIGGLFVTGLATHHTDGESVQRNVSFLFDFDGLTVLHLGALSHVPDQSVVQDLGQVSVLLLPVGGALKAAQAAEIVAMIEPYYVVPMHYALPGMDAELDTVDKFLKAMGVTKAHELDTLKVTANDAPEQTQVVVLTPQAVVANGV